MSDRRRSIALPIIVLLFGIAGAVLLARSRRAPKAAKPKPVVPLVEVIQVNPTTLRVEVSGEGTVRSAVRVKLVPQVSGRVVSVSKSFVVGGSFKKGESLLRIDPRDFKLAVEQAEADVAAAEVKSRLEQAEADLAREEWQDLHPGEGPASDLVLRVPQLRGAEAAQRAARARLEQAKLALERTTLSLPFAGRVESESVDPGQFVVAGQPVATVYGTDLMEVPIPLRDDELAWFETGTAKALVEANFQGSDHRYEGSVTRLEGIDPLSRMATVVVAIPSVDEKVPLYPGLFVRARIEGREIENAAAIPSSAMRQGDTVWIVKDGSLEIRPVSVARRGAAQTIVSDGLSDGDLLVTSALDAVTNGMAVEAESS